MRMKKHLVFAFAVFLIAGIFASYSIGSPKHSIKEIYSKGAFIQGPINISFSNESGNSLFSDSNGNSIKLIDLLETDSRHNYNCYPDDCNFYYSATNGQQTKTIDFTSKNETFTGFKLTGELSGINSVNFKIESPAERNCNNQLKIDLFNDGVFEIGNYKSHAEDCGTIKNYGCFNSSQTQKTEWELNDRFCQGIKLPEAPGFVLGAWVKNESGTLNLTMELFTKDGEPLGDEGAMCYLPAPTSQEGEVSCEINYLVTKENDYYACVYPRGNGKYWVRGYRYIDECGFYGNPVPDETPYALQFYAIPKKFAAIGTLTITNNLSSGETLADLISEYIDEKNSGLDCGNQGCVIPIRLVSGVSQSVTLKELTLSYEQSDGAVTSEKNFFDVAETPPLITATKQNIYLDKGNFSVPNSVGPYYFKLYFKNSLLFSKRVEVQKGVSILSVYPLKTARAFATDFNANLDGNASKYEWDFGDNSTIETTTTGGITHTYSSVGNYTLLLKIEDNQGISSSRSFQVEVGSVGTILKSLINQTRNDLNRITSNLSGYDSFSSDAIKKILNSDETEQKLTKIELDYNLISANGTESDYDALLVRIIEINIPNYIYRSLDSEPLTFYPEKADIDLDVLTSVGGGDYGDLEDEYKDAILSWNLENIDMKISIDGFSANYGSQDSTLLNTLELDIDDLGSEGTSYLFIQSMTGMQFKNNSNFSEDSGYYYKEFSGDEIVEFYTTQSISFESLPIFISPAITSLNVISDDEPTKQENEFNWMLFGIAIGGVVLLGIIIYFYLKSWYKNKYESHLFKNKNDLYNIVNYIQNARQQGKQEKEIISDLKKANWGSEQINYVMKKFKGKKVGL